MTSEDSPVGAGDGVKVLQVNIRLSEGGAAGVARTLHDELGKFGVESAIAYGYAPGGYASPLAPAYGAVRTTSRNRAAANLIAHRLTGVELFGPDRERAKSLAAAIDECDVVHLHAIHSYMMPPKSLLRTVIAARKPIVWTMHDQWIMTGRCAQPGSCVGWKTGCDPCQDRSAYPPASVDRAARRFVEKRAYLDDLAAQVPLAMVACADWLRREMLTAGMREARTITNSVDPAFWSLVGELDPRVEDDERSFLFMCRDLRDSNKVDMALLRRIALAHPGKLTIVGDNAPSAVPGANMVPAAADRQEIVELMLRHTHLVFSSTVDYYPLTIAEALTAGMSVIAADSPAIREFADYPRVITVSDDADWDAALAAALGAPDQSAPTVDRNRFAPARMASQYADLYKEVLSR